VLIRQLTAKIFIKVLHGSQTKKLLAKSDATTNNKAHTPAKNSIYQLLTVRVVEGFDPA
jgi:hypothetical protein